jgi:hypothetical protein
MPRSVSILLSALLVAAPAGAETFKCPGQDGRTVYQNFPCDVSTLGSTPGAWAPAPPAAPAPAPARPVAAAPSPPASPAPKPAAVATAPAQPGSAPPRLQIGMTNDQVRSAWGAPADAYAEEPPQGQRTEVWTYDNNRVVRFDNKGRVSEVRQ